MTNLLSCLRSSGIRLKTAKRLHNHDIIKMIHSPTQSQNIFKDDRLMKSEIPYRPMASNIPLVMDKRTLSIGSNIKDDKYALLSFGTYSHIVHGLHCNLNFHGNINESVEEHLFIHMMSLLNHSNLNITLEICADMEKDLCLIRDIMNRFCFQSNRPNSTSNIITYYERSMKWNNTYVVITCIHMSWFINWSILLGVSGTFFYQYFVSRIRITFTMYNILFLS